MTYSEVKDLLAAGFTHDEIMAFVQDNPQNAQVFHNTNINPVNTEIGSENDGSTQEDQQESDLDRAGAPEKNTNIPENDDKFNQLTSSIQKLIKTIQVSNLQNASFGNNKETDINSEVDHIMASIIRPDHEKGGSSK